MKTPMRVAVRNLKGEEVGTADLNPALFDMPMNDPLVHQVFVSLSRYVTQTIRSPSAVPVGRLIVTVLPLELPALVAARKL